jgi:hypothetical protein
MVLKVVRGKILETLELASFPGGAWFRFGTARGRCLGRAQRVSRRGGASAVRLSKIDDYLADNFCVPMLAELMDGFKEKVVGSRS